MPPSACWFFCTERDVSTRLDASGNDPEPVMALFQGDYDACDGHPQVIATGPDDGLDDSLYNETGFSWQATRRIVRAIWAGP